jgi:hypothetical protein
MRTSSPLPLSIPAPTAPQAFVYESNVSRATYLFNNSHVSMADAQRSCSENGGHLAAFRCAPGAGLGSSQSFFRHDPMPGYEGASCADCIDEMCCCLLHTGLWRSRLTRSGTSSTRATFCLASTRPTGWASRPRAHTGRGGWPAWRSTPMPCLSSCAMHWLQVAARWHALTCLSALLRFNWTDSSIRPPSGATYMHWGRDGLVPEPSNSTGSELCGVANLTQTYGGAWGWSDTRCNISAPFMCRSMGERPPSAACSAAGTLADFYPLCVAHRRLQQSASMLGASSHPSTLLIGARAGFGPAPAYTVPSTNATFFLNTSHVTHAQAEQACVANGGHLAVFSTLGEQVRRAVPEGLGCWAAASRPSHRPSALAACYAHTAGSLAAGCCGEVLHELGLPAAFVPQAVLAGLRDRRKRLLLEQLHGARGKRGRWRLAWPTQEGMLIRVEVAASPPAPTRFPRRPLTARWPTSRGAAGVCTRTACASRLSPTTWPARSSVWLPTRARPPAASR